MWLSYSAGVALSLRRSAFYSRASLRIDPFLLCCLVKRRILLFSVSRCCFTHRNSSKRFFIEKQLENNSWTKEAKSLLIRSLSSFSLKKRKEKTIGESLPGFLSKQGDRHALWEESNFEIAKKEEYPYLIHKRFSHLGNLCSKGSDFCKKKGEETFKNLVRNKLPRSN